MEMRYGTPAAVPTLGEWGLIGLTILLLFSGIYFVSKKNQLV
ncbi:MAG: IPTL-CTERM sorting domain-containing protein [Bacteroidetes bacterium]|nr:IPTL-CTERM sorting domain-containing protein [Bacteroidota bacterium]